MQSRSATTCLVLSLALAGLLANVAGAQVKSIRLRNGTIPTSDKAPGTSSQRPSSEEPAASGLFLVQFEGPCRTEWTEALRGLGVELLRYIPDDAFIARFASTRPSEVGALAFVRWVGPYQPAHKVHSGLRAAAAGDALWVSVLVAPRSTPPELATTRARFQSLHSESRGGPAIVLRGRVLPGRLRELAESPAVLWIEPGPWMKLFDEISTKLVAGDAGPGVTAMMDLGYDGTGVTVAVADSGLHVGDPENTHPDLTGRVVAQFFYDDLTDASDEHSHGTHCAGIIAGNGATGETDEAGYLYGLGVAPGVNLVAQRIFDGVGEYKPPPSFGDLTRDAVSAGAEVGSNSWGDDTQGRYDISAMEFDALVRDADPFTPGDQPYILEFSAGNAGPGPQTIGSPAVAKNVIATGASQNDRIDFFIYADGPETLADFSSRGPCEDGRIKPDVVAPGTWIASLRSPIGDDNNAWADISGYYLYQGGTSQAGPHVSGAAAILVQWYRDTMSGQTPSPALVKALLIDSTLDLDDGETTSPATPNFDEGWGQVDLTQVIGGFRQLDLTDQTVPLTTGQTWEQSIIVADETEPLRLTLAYTDVPAFPGALPALVNDLDLELVGPDGATYRGNQFLDGESVPGAPSADAVNNVEGIYIDGPLRGEYIVRVRARNVPQDATSGTPAIDQDFALVVSGGLPLPGQGVLVLDRPAYRAPGRAFVRLLDRELDGQITTRVTVSSTTEPAGFMMNLRATGGAGVFTGSVALATGPAVNDSLLQVAHGDVITVRHGDGTGLRTATALADLVAPVITDLRATNEFGATVVRWNTDEPANSVVLYSTNAADLSGAKTNLFFTASDHGVELAGLVVGRTYYYRVVSTDHAGNSATAPSGPPASFVVQRGATALLVDDYIHDPTDPFLPLSGYTNALRSLGVSFDVWRRQEHANSLPGLNQLLPYRVVIWRLNDSFRRSSDIIPAVQQTAIQQYLAQGGAFFFASMESLSRLLNTGSGAFVSNVLHVSSFSRNDILNPCADCDEDHMIPSLEAWGNHPIAQDVDLTLDYFGYPFEDFIILQIGPDLGDTFKPATNATPVFGTPGALNPCAIAYPPIGVDATGRVVFFSFPLDTIPENQPPPNNRATILHRVLQFLVPGLGGSGSIALDREEYTTPDLMTVEVADEDLIGQTNLVVEVTSSSFPSPVPLTLHPTVTPGVLRGAALLVRATDPPGPGRLRATDGDTIQATYLDGATPVTATAYIDTVPPSLSTVQAEPEYEDAVVSWDTSELTDALVAFGESTFLGRTAYVPDLDISHSVLLSGLVPGRLYFFKVISRDAAGNPVEDDNGGRFYTFNTRTPLRAPFFDDFEGGDLGWTTFNSDDTESVWTLGSPNNGLEEFAYSPSHCWGSSLNGSFAGTIDTFLISPAIELTGGNRATLRFWQSYDFSERGDLDLLEGGELLLFTNNYVGPVTLATYFDFGFGWEEQEFDLTPYVGHVIFLVWHHQLLAFDNATRGGWLIDDVSITMSNQPPGVIRVTNNLAQARFNLSGPMPRSGQGWLSVFTNAPPGEFRTAWLAVPWHDTPPAQTNVLASGGSLTFTGYYTFADANQNGMSDAWEMAMFGMVSPNRTRTTDTDADGFTDYAEFIAGTSPLQPNSSLRLAAPVRQPNGTLRLEWPSVSGRAYLVEGSSDAIHWQAVSGWLQATLSTTSFTLPAAGQTVPNLFRVQVRP